MDLWSNHRQYSPPLLQHQYGQFRTLPQPGPIASSRSTRTHFHATSEPSTVAALDTGTSRKPTHTTAASSNASDWMAHHPTTHSTAATGLADQWNSSSPWSSISEQIWTDNTIRRPQKFKDFVPSKEESAKTRADLCLLTVFFSFSLFFFVFSFVLFVFFFWRRGNVT